ncbi:hypothetical protein LXA43DRAFT_1096669 [Ganoderma leucocontextum]|nr:hypothetical protein LXA43DRAFT_1096669 [Ganoderma leucocontextum]
MSTRKRGRTSDPLPRPTTASNLTPVVHVPKRPRTTGELSRIMNLDTDVFREIVSHLHPLDLLHLARTSRLLRKTILARNSIGAWKKSIGSVEGLPACPKDMSESVYAALVFDRHCFLCGANGSTWVDYAIRLRLCKTCHAENIKEASELIDDLPRYKPGLQFIVCQGGTALSAARHFMTPDTKHKTNNKYYVLDVERMQAVNILTYLGERGVEKAELRAVAREKRISDIKLRLAERGYAEEDFPHHDTKWRKLLEQPKELTDRIWKKLLPELTTLIKTSYQRQAARERATRISTRFDAIIYHYGNFTQSLTVEEYDFMPNTYDARRLRPIIVLARENGAQATVSYDDFLTISSRILDEVAAYKAEVQRVLVALICETSPAVAADLAGLDPATALRRYPAAFWCHEDCTMGYWVRRYMTCQDVHAHWRAMHTDMPFVKRVPRMDPHKRVNVPTLGPFSFPQLAREMLEVACISLDTEREVLDQWVKDGRLFCDCGDSGMRVTANNMGWMNLVGHILHHTWVYYARKELMKDNGHPLPDIPIEGQPFLYEDHPLPGLDNPSKCVLKFLPEGAGMAPASYRLKIVDDHRRQVNRNLRLLRLSSVAEEFVWHISVCHGKKFEKQDIVWFNGDSEPNDNPEQ